MRLASLFVLFTLGLGSCGSEPEPGKPLPTQTSRDYSSLTWALDSITKTVPAQLTLGYINIETGDSFSYHGHELKPMQSTAKFPLALMVMQQVDAGKLTLEQKIPVSKADMAPNVNSLLSKSRDGKADDVPVREMLDYMMTASDNISCDVLTRLVGGVAALEGNTRKLGMESFRVVPRAAIPHAIDFGRPYENVCRPMDMAELLARFYTGSILSRQSTDTLRSMMERARGDGRIKGLLPKGTVVAHKTGTSGTSGGITTAVNDIGIVTLPNGQHLVLAVYVNEVKGDMAAGEAIIGRVAKAAYDFAINH
jgi:beta-lactamase class A